MLSFLSGLQSDLGADLLVTDPDILQSYQCDMADFTAAHQPLALVRPRSTADVSKIVTHCENRGVPIVARGSGTGLSGGANALTDCIIVSFERMNKILHIDPIEYLAIVQPGVINADLRNECAEQSLWYSPDPASNQWSSIGGNVSTNAGGLSCVKYGVTRDYVMELEVVVSGGKVVRLGGKTAKRAAGYDLKNLFVGSGGTLGLITEITVKLRPPQAEPKTIVGYFDTLESAGAAANKISESKIIPSMFELIDRQCLLAVDEWRNMNISVDCNVMLVAQTDTPGGTGEFEADTILTCFREAGASWSDRSINRNEAQALMQARQLVHPALERKGQLRTEDICVPKTRVPEMLARIREIADDFGVSIANIAHIGDGNIHPICAILEHDKARLEEKSAKAFEEIINSAIQFGGTVSGEHGVGLLKKKGFVQEAGVEVLSMHRAIKSSLDPAGIFNPGKIFDQ